MTRYLYDDKIGFLSLVDRMQSDAALKVVNSARISYAKQTNEYTNKDKQLAVYLREHGHTSPFRHTYYTFHIKAPLFVFRQLMKYQVGSVWRTYEVSGTEVGLDIFEHMYDTDKGCNWNEISGRYATLKEEFYIPSLMRANTKHGSKQSSEALPLDFDHNKWRFYMHTVSKKAFARYNEMLNAGIAKEIARMVLPQNIYSEAYWTLSLQAVLHFLDQRLSPDAQFEIRAVAIQMKDLLKDDLLKIGVEV